MKPDRTAPDRSMVRRVLVTSILGMSIEFYDFFIYALASATVLPKLFFPSFDPLVGTIASFGSFAVGYLARPIGAVVFGHIGDRIGRKASLVATLLIMGLATSAIGLLPTHATIGIWAPVGLLAMRFIQGFGVGGEWGGAVLLALEYAPPGRRGLFGSCPQIGVPVGLLLATGVISLVSNLGQDQFLGFAWRIPFLLSIVLIGVGVFIRLRVIESPIFREAQQRGTQDSLPIAETLSGYPKDLLFGMGTAFAVDLTFTIISVFGLYYGTQVLGLSRNLLLDATLVGCVAEIITVPLFGLLSDRIGRRPVFLMGAVCVMVYAFAFYWLMETREPAIIIFAYAVGFATCHGALYAVQGSWFAELFGTSVRYTGMSFAYQVSKVFTTGPAPFLCTWLFATYHATWPISAYIALAGLVGLVCALNIAETFRRDITVDPRAEPTAAAAVTGLGLEYR
jgi:MHS family shikimate/dehydroshikimate transporter-like MFS transporter